MKEDEMDEFKNGRLICGIYVRLQGAKLGGHIKWVWSIIPKRILIFFFQLGISSPTRTWNVKFKNDV